MPAGEVAKKDAVLVLWVPGSLLQEGLDVMSAWGFKQKQVHVWVKTKKTPFISFRKSIPMPKVSEIRNNPVDLFKGLRENIKSAISSFKLENILAFGMGRLFR